jgi:formylglycine-generating enzyme required for sulfatase activity
VQKFIKKLNSLTGRQYRLPTEAEWEYACYSENQTEYCGSNDANAVSWHKDNSNGGTHPVGQKQANAYGLYDMSGNVWEWMQDWYDGNPKEGKSVRGGSWLSKPQDERASHRNPFDHFDPHSSQGFRLARTISTSTTQPIQTNQANLSKGYVSQGGLIWMPINSSTKNWSDANAYCVNTAINEQTGWRLPKDEELRALYKSGAMNNLEWELNVTWSSTPFSLGHHNIVILTNGFEGSTADTERIYMTCVRGKSAVEAKPIQQSELSKGYVSQGGLTWLPINSSRMTWSDAKAYCTNTAINGQIGWRLPTKEKLKALYDSGAMKDQGWSLHNTWTSTPDGIPYGLDDDSVPLPGDPIRLYVTCVR